LTQEQLERKAARLRARKAADPEKYRAKNHAYYEANKEKWHTPAANERHRAASLAYWRRNKKDILARIRGKRGEYMREYAKAYVTVGGERMNLNTVPPEMREAVRLLVELRRASRSKSGGAR
jgi:hypothetical protein